MKFQNLLCKHQTEDILLQDIQNPEIYPNPATDIVRINHLPIESTVAIFDTAGRKIFSKKYSETNISIDVSVFISGIYIIQIDSAEKNILSKKLLINK
ncbi:T9SS type A sorting domain-containing protein [Chryseobacterium sp. CBo1]|uniref:T9SS type A sorting domain-containing protein n=1 Tax=Chryseobacterium sp. CBo1 TaxID=1869230 RepID=UPI0013F4DB33|nr:T9SS type A sorting domain-containing protein [Chryseobacterium sp. CBo1]